MKGNRLLTLATMVVIVSLMSVVDVFSKAMAPWLSRAKRATARWQGYLDMFRVWRLTGASMSAALLFCTLAPIAGGATLTEGQHAGQFLISEAPALRSRDGVTVLSGQTLKAGAVVGRVTRGIGRVSIPTVVGTGTGTCTLVTAGPEVEVGNYVLECITAVTNGGVFSLTTPSGKLLPNLTLTVGAGATTAYTSRHINFSITENGDFADGDTFTFVVGTTAPAVIGGTGTGVLSALSLGPDAKPGNYRVVFVAAISQGGRLQVISPDGDALGEFTLTAATNGASAFTSRQINFTITEATDFIVGNHFNVAVFNQLSGGKAVAWDPTTFDGRHTAAGVLYDNVDAAAGDLKGVLITRDAEVRSADLQWGAAITAAQKDSATKDLAISGVIVR